jgi:hypothetical protein
MRANMTNLEKKQIDLIRESICVYARYAENRALFKQGKLHFTNIEEFVDDKGRSCLFRLKEMCHELFRSSDQASYKEKLYDITVGYIFHEAMKLRENLYQLEYYGPGRDKVPLQLTDLEKKVVREIEALTNKSRKKLSEGVKEVRTLVIELVSQLKGLIQLYKDNYLLARFIVENEKSFVSIYGKKGFERLLTYLYGDGREMLMFEAAKSYLDSEYYETARPIFRRISAIDRTNNAALFFYMYASAFDYYFKNKFSSSFVFAQQANVAGLKLEGIEAYREQLQKLLSDLSKETRKKKRM